MNPFSDADFMVRARLPRTEMQMLDKFVEGLGHLGVVSTTNKELGEVVIRTTRYCWPELKTCIERLGLEIVVVSLDA